MQAYRELEERFARIATLTEMGEILHWDMSTKMPPGGAAGRADHLALQEVLSHQMITDPALADLLPAAAEEPLDDWQRANLAEMRRRWLHATALDGVLVDRLAKAATATEMAWRTARETSDFAAVRPLLGGLLALIREKAAALSEALGLTPYDALLDAYEPGGRIRDIEPVFDELAAFLPGFLSEVLERQARAPAPLDPPGPFDRARQTGLAHGLMADLGFDFDRGRLDSTFHPFCGGTPDDTRVTTRYDDDDLTEGLMCVIHETGHALYEQGLPRSWRRQPVGEARGMSLHESQSLLFEMQLCRSRDFFEFAAPRLAAAFDGSGPAWSADNLYRRAIRVERGFIRVEADEVTYPAHVILRTRLERAMVAGDLDVADLPGAWNDGMAELLGVVPPDDRRGCLQDIHWYGGDFGYFPTYTLGAMTAAQIFAVARRRLPDLAQDIRRGDFGPLLDWLRSEIHGRASLLSTGDLLRQVTGEPLNPAFFEEHLRARYLP